MTSNPFQGMLSPEEFRQEQQRERQSKFAGRVVEKVLKAYGVAPKVINLIKRQSLKGTTDRHFDLTWFNNHGDYPVKLGAKMFSPTPSLDAFVHTMLWHNEDRFLKRPAVQEVFDVEDAWGGTSAGGTAFVTKMAGSTSEIVLYRGNNLGLDAPSDSGVVVRTTEAEDTFVLLKLETFLSRFEWTPPMEVIG